MKIENIRIKLSYHLAPHRKHEHLNHRNTEIGKPKQCYLIKVKQGTSEIPASLTCPELGTAQPQLVTVQSGG